MHTHRITLARKCLACQVTPTTLTTLPACSSIRAKYLAAIFVLFMALCSFGCSACLLRGIGTSATTTAVRGLTGVGIRAGAAMGPVRGSLALSQAARAGRLAAMLEEVTAGRSASRAILSTDKTGALYHDGFYLGRIHRDGSIIRSTDVLGRIRNSKLYEADTFGFAGRQIGEVRASVAAPTVAMRYGPSEAFAIVKKLRQGSTLDLVRFHEGWYEVTLMDGTSGWVFAPLIALVATSSSLHGFQSVLGDRKSSSRVYSTTDEIYRLVPGSVHSAVDRRINTHRDSRGKVYYSNVDSVYR